MSIELYFALVALGFAAWFGFRKWQEWRREQHYLKPVPEDWPAKLNQSVGLYKSLPQDLKESLHGHIHYFLADKEFVGCDDLEVTEDMKLIIAANACLLVLKGSRPIYPTFETILLYPDTYVVKQKSHAGDVVFDDNSVRQGESWFRGPIVLSWADVKRGSENHADGLNVVIHEFAHKLDEENGVMDGLPILRKAAHYPEWSKVLSEEYDDFLKRVSRRKNKVIDEYGSVSGVEFFAVISESFFEKAKRMKRDLPELYEQLQKYYDVDPATWSGE